MYTVKSLKNDKKSIVPVGSYYYITNSTTSSTKYYLQSAGDSSSTQLTTTTNSLDTGTKWSFAQYTGNVIDNLKYITAPESVVVGQQYTYKAVMSCSRRYLNGPVKYSVSDTNMATITSAGVLTPKKAGTVKVGATYNGAPWVWYRTVRITRMPNPNAQNKNHWCWAACSKMVGEHNGGSGALNTGATVLENQDGLHSYDETPFYGEDYNNQYTVDAGQRQIVIFCHGDDANYSGDNINKENALQLSSLNTMEIGTLGNGSLTNVQIDFMNNELANGRWVIGNIFANAGMLGHSIVIKSYDATTEIYTYWDPWTGKEKTFSRTNLLNNTIRIEANNYYYGLSWVQYCR